ncbi:gpW family head-tail joining protein [Morganella morganii]|uniref:gpW family head-tail joining protein n=1 Tax=Morganella morganii TaxID=582 RepID=UPI0034DD7C84
MSTGAKGVSFSYTQGDGTRSVSYQQTSLGDLLALIQTIQAMLGISRRRPIRVRY